MNLLLQSLRVGVLSTIIRSSWETGNLWGTMFELPWSTSKKMSQKQIKRTRREEKQRQGDELLKTQGFNVNNPQDQKASPFGPPPFQQNLQIRQEEWIIGPTPPAKEMERWAAIIPDAPERILRMVEKQADHRMDQEKKDLAHRQDIQKTVIDTEKQSRVDEIKIAKRGQWFAMFGVVLFAGLGIWIVKEGHDLAGSLIAILGPTSSMVASFLGRSKEQAPQKGSKESKTASPK